MFLKFDEFRVALDIVLLVVRDSIFEDLPVLNGMSPIGCIFDERRFGLRKRSKTSMHVLYKEIMETLIYQ